jgi:hypothetical protein
MITAMQELIDSFYKRPQDFRYLGLIISECEKLLEKEKQQIIEAFVQGRDNSIDYFTENDFKLTEENYYNKTFKD